MNVATKLTVVLLLAIVAVHAIMGSVRLTRVTQRFEEEMREDAAVYGRTLAALVRVAWLEGGEEQVSAQLATANAAEEAFTIAWRSGPTRERFRADERGLHAALPVTLPDGSMGAIVIDDPQSDEEAYLRETLRNIVLGAALLALLCSLAAAILLQLFVGRPTRLLVEHARRVGAGDLEARIALSGRDELAQLGEEMNRMTSALREARERSVEEARRRFEAVEQLRHVDRLRTIGTLASGIAHELGTPLNVAQGHAQLLRDASDPEAAAAGEAIVKQCRRMTTIVQQLLAFARASTTDEGDAEVGAVARETGAMLSLLGKKRGVSIEVRADGALRVDVPPERLRQLLSNLVVNAIHASHEGQRVELAVAREGDEAVVEVRDQGVGMDEATLARVFDPFFTTKDVGEGTGLGLSVAYGIVQDAGGSLSATSAPGAGSCFVVRLPVSTRSAGATSATAPSDPQPSGPKEST
jgi:two-component system NtrC family sensor kinase